MENYSGGYYKRDTRSLDYGSFGAVLSCIFREVDMQQMSGSQGLSTLAG